MATEKLYMILRVDHDEKMHSCVSLVGYGSEADKDQILGECKVQDLDDLDEGVYEDDCKDALQILKPLGELTNEEVLKVWDQAVASGLNISYHVVETTKTPNGPPE